MHFQKFKTKKKENPFPRNYFTRKSNMRICFHSKFFFIYFMFQFFYFLRIIFIFVKFNVTFFILKNTLVSILLNKIYLDSTQKVPLVVSNFDAHFGITDAIYLIRTTTCYFYLKLPLIYIYAFY